MRLIRDGEKGGRGYGGGERGRLYTYRYAVTTRLTSALRWAAMRATLMFHNCEGQSQIKTASTNHNLFEEKGEPKRYRTEVLPLTSLTPYRQAKPAHKSVSVNQILFNNNNVHLSCAHQRPERSHDTY